MNLVKGEVQPRKENFSFTPVINKNSGKLAQGCAHLGNTLYERTKAAKEIRELKWKKAKEISDNQGISKTAR